MGKGSVSEPMQAAWVQEQSFVTYVCKQMIHFFKSTNQFSYRSVIWLVCNVRVFIFYFLIFSPCLSSGYQSYSAFFPWLDCCTKSQWVFPGLQVDGKKSVLSAAVVLCEHTEEMTDELPSSFFIQKEFHLHTFVYLYIPLPFSWCWSSYC